MSGVRHLHIDGGFGDPRIYDMAWLEQVLRGIKLSQTKGGRKQLVRLPITPDLLFKLKSVYMGWQECQLGWLHVMGGSSAFLDSCVPGKLQFHQTLSFKDVAVDNLLDPKVIRVHLKASKSDPFRKGVDVFVGITNHTLCPVSAILVYLAARGSNPGPFFRFEDGRPLTRMCFVSRVKEALAAVGVDQSAYSGHRFRSGAATTAASQGIGDATIKMLGRWKSNVYQLYIQTPKDQLAAFSRQLVLK